MQALVSQRGNTFAQCLVYAFAFCLFASIFIVRESLIAQWQQQIPENAPNHFLINITEPQVKGVKELLASNGINVSHMYPMVRGRMSHINGEDVKVAVTKDVAALNRELNLSWVEDMPEGNEIVDGAWVSDSEGLSVSVEQELTDNIGVSLGDSLTFNVAGLEVVATVSSIRKVDWESMKPNFYVLFKDGALNDFPNTYIASFYLPE
ncbi:ABC transporter permease, partial [Oleiphilus sp. HI0066]|uniref:ABC transporter permease n=1 Tax=Oleiphilus sp. HI0066 TaxID=1822242 RepID=UPI0035165D5D